MSITLTQQLWIMLSDKFVRRKFPTNVELGAPAAIRAT